MHMRQRDVEFLKLRQNIMNEYFMDMKKFTDEFEEVSKLNEDLLADNPYISEMNLDNYPTHKDTDGNEYCAASKNYMKVDPKCSDTRSLHYAGEDRVYLIFKNGLTDAWEFPTGQIFIGQTLIRAK